MKRANLQSPIFFDPTILRKSNIVDDSFAVSKANLPLPAIVELSTSGTCNRVCSFCPRSDPSYPNKEEFMPMELTKKLTGQLAEVNFSGLLVFSGFVEPLLDKNIYDRIAFLRAGLPESRIEVVTNGDVLNEKRLRRLFTSGLSTLQISVYDSEEDADSFENMCQQANLQDDQFVIRRRYLPPEQDFGITMNNRAGMMNNTEFRRPSLIEPLPKPCFYPSYLFFMDYLGDVLMCAHDWGKKMVAGNLHNQDFMDIWFSQLMMTSRRRLNQSDRNFSPCDVCDVQGFLVGKKHADAWARSEKLLFQEKTK